MAVKRQYGSFCFKFNAILMRVRRPHKNKLKIIRTLQFVQGARLVISKPKPQFFQRQITLPAL
jgi:hypothetical protein